MTLIVVSGTRYGRDGANYTSRATFDCFYDPENHDHVIIDYQVWWWLQSTVFITSITSQPERTKFYLLLWSLLPGTVMFISCIYMCVCRFPKFLFRKLMLKIFSFSASSCSQATMGTWGSSVVEKQSQVSFFLFQPFPKIYHDQWSLIIPVKLNQIYSHNLTGQFVFITTIKLFSNWSIFINNHVTWRYRRGRCVQTPRQEQVVIFV